jgi:hypothetical protein
MLHASQITAAIEERHLEADNPKHAAAWHLPADGIEEATRSLVLGLAEYTMARQELDGTTLLELVILNQVISHLSTHVVSRPHGRLDHERIRETLQTLAGMVADTINGQQDGGK